MGERDAAVAAVGYNGPMSRLAPVVGSLAARFLGLVLLVAAWAKVIDPARFAGELSEMTGAPPALASLLALAVVGYEAGLGAALLAGWRAVPVLAATSATFVFFTGVVAYQMFFPSESGASCGCFGMLLERTPAQALTEDVVLVAVSGLAWIGRTAAAPRSRLAVAAVAALAAVGLGLAAPSLPLDDHATALAPGMSVDATGLGDAVPELATGRHLVLLLDRADPDTVAAVGPLNQGLGLPGGKTPVVGVAAEDAALAAQFLWTAGPAFEVRSVSPAMLRRLYRTLPRSALLDDGRVVATWNGFPPPAAQAALSRGELP